MRIAMSVYVYYSLSHLFSRHGGGGGGVGWEKWELQCLFVYNIPLITYFPNMEELLTAMRIAMYMCILFPWSPISPTWMGSSQKWEFHCLYLYIIPLITYFPKHGRGCSHKWELQCLYVYIIPSVTYFPKHGGGFSEKWELHCLYVYIIPLITYFPQHGCVAHRNENCNVCTCILFPWSPICPTWMCSSQKWELQCLYVYIIPINSNFPKHGVGCSHKWDLQCLYVYIIPLITYFPDMEGFAERNENCNVCACVLFLWSPISPTWRGLLTEMRIAMYVYVYYSLDHLFTRQGGCCWEKLEFPCLYVYIIPLLTYFPKHGGGCSQKWELQCMYVYNIPLITYFPNMEELLTAMRIAMYIRILFPWSPIFQTWSGLLREIIIPMSVCVYYSLDHLFPQTWKGLLT